jgi:hypothetical protein
MGGFARPTTPDKPPGIQAARWPTGRGTDSPTQKACVVGSLGHRIRDDQDPTGPLAA